MKKRWIFLSVSAFLIGILPVLLANFVLPYTIIKPYKPFVSHEDESFSLQVDEGLSLAMRFFLPEQGKPKGAVILLHGIGSCKEHQYGLAEELAEKGWAALTYDARAHGESQGEYCSFGYHEKHDLVKIKTLVREKIGEKLPIGVWGHSMGAAVALQSLALDPDWAFGVILSPFAELDQIVLDRMEKYSYIRWKLYSDYVLEKAGEIAAFDPNKVSPSTSARAIHQPIFLAHGSADKAILPSHGKNVFENLASQDIEFYLIEGAGHNNLFDVGGAVFKEKLFAFLEKQELSH